MASSQSERLLALARRLVDALPADIVAEAAATGSVSRGVADDVSDIELLLVTTRELELEECYRLAAAAGLEELATWKAQETRSCTRSRSGRRARSRSGRSAWCRCRRRLWRRRSKTRR